MSQQTAYMGNRFSYQDITIEGTVGALYGGQAFTFAKGIVQNLNWDSQQDAGIVQGNRVTIMGRTTGYGTCTGSLELLVSECDDWFGTITSQGAFPVMAVYFDTRITYSVNGADVRIDVLQGCRITKVGAANQKGNDAITKTIDLSIAVPYQNQIALYNDPSNQ